MIVLGDPGLHGKLEVKSGLNPHLKIREKKKTKRVIKRQAGKQKLQFQYHNQFVKGSHVSIPGIYYALS